MPLLSGVLNTANNAGSRGAYHPAQNPNPMVRNNPLVPANTPATDPPAETLTTPIQQFTDELQAVQPPVTPNVGSSVRVYVGTVQEEVSNFLATEQRTVTAFIDQYVPIPWMHGDQRPTVANA